MFAAIRSASRAVSSKFISQAQAQFSHVALPKPAVNPLVQNIFSAGKASPSVSSNPVLMAARSIQGTLTQAMHAQRRAMSSATAESTGMFSGLGKMMADNPVMTAVIVTVVRTAPCDLLAQFYFEKRESLDWARFIGFNLFGAVYVGAFQYYLYRYFLNASLVNAVGITGKAPEAFSIAVLDQFVHSPFLYFPAFCFTLKLTQFSPNLIQDSFNKWKDEVVGVVKASMTLWFPTQIINFYFMPPYLIVPFINVVGAVWVVWLSLQQGKKKDEA